MNILAEGGTVTLLGVLIVFTCLVLIIVVIKVLTWIMTPRPKKEEPKAEVKFEEAMHEPLPEVPDVEVENIELVAVLTAAVAAFMEESPSKLVVRSYRRVSPDSAWARAGRSAQIYNKF